MSCKQCGTCCKYFVAHISEFAYDIAYIKARDGILIGQKVFFHHPCKHLLENGKCGIQDRKPRFCQPGYETNYKELQKLGCKYLEKDLDADGNLNIHINETVGATGKLS